MTQTITATPLQCPPKKTEPPVRFAEESIVIMPTQYVEFIPATETGNKEYAEIAREPNIGEYFEVSAHDAPPLQTTLVLRSEPPLEILGMKKCMP